MSKRGFTKDSDLQKLTLSPTSTPEETNLTYLTKLKVGPKFSSTSLKGIQVKGPDPSLEEKKKLEKSYSGSMVEDKTRSHSLATPNDQGNSKGNYLSDKSIVHKTERSSSVSPPQKKESAGLFSRSSSKSFRNTPMLSLRHKDDHPRSPIHLKIKDHFMGKSFINPKPAPNSSSWVKKENVPLKEFTEPRQVRGGHFPLRPMKRPTQHHTFSSDASDVQQIEKKLLQLMEDFETGKLKAFGKDSRLRQMEEIREQQERLARLHFDVGAKQDLYPPLSEDGLRISDENMRTLMEKLAQLSESIENLQTNTTDKKASIAEVKHSNPMGNVATTENHLNQSSSHHSDTLHHSPFNNVTLQSPNRSPNVQIPKTKESMSGASHNCDINPHSTNSRGTGMPLMNTAGYENSATTFSMKLNNFPKQEAVGTKKQKHDS